jgi:hypothetical protein
MKFEFTKQQIEFIKKACLFGAKNKDAPDIITEMYGDVVRLFEKPLEEQEDKKEEKTK